MSIQFVLGQSGSGKSYYLYHYMIKEADKYPDKQFMFLVPEQFTMHIQKTLVELHPRHSVMNIEVLSFERLAYRVFDELGTDVKDVLEDTGKSLILRKLAEDHAEELTVLKENIDKIGYIEEIKSLISEFMQYCILPEDLTRISEISSMSSSFQKRNADIQILYKAFLDYIDGSYITTEEILELLNLVVNRSGFVRGSVIAFDGYTGFTPIQTKLLYQMLPLAEKSLFAIDLQKEIAVESPVLEHELFAMSKKMARSILKIAEDTGLEVLTPITLFDNPDKRHIKKGRLEHLEKQIFKSKPEKYPEEMAAAALDQVKILHVTSPYEELCMTAYDIRKHLREEKCHYKDFAIVCANLDDYKYLAEEVFRKYEIPIFLDAKTDLTFHPAIEFVKAVLSMLRDNFSYDSVFHFLKCGISDIAAEDLDQLENYFLATGLRGYRAFEKDFKYRPEGLEEEKLAYLNTIREKVRYLIEPICCYKKSGTYNVLELTRDIYQVVDRCGLALKMTETAAKLQESGDRQGAREYEQMYDMIISLMEKIVHLMGKDSLSLKQYEEIFLSGINSAAVGSIPSGNDLVIIGDIERTRLEDISYLYFIGVNDTAVPKAVSGGGIYTEADRLLLKEAEIELAPTARDKAFMQKFYLYQILTKPSKGLTLSYSRLKSNGDSVRASYLIAMILELFPEIKIAEYASLPEEIYLESDAMVAEYLSNHLRNYMLTGQEERLGLILRYLKQHNEAEYQLLLDAATVYYRGDAIGKAAIKAVNGEGIHGSVTKLEKYASCAYSYFLTYLLKLKERKEHEISALDMGNLYHKALESYSLLLADSEFDWHTISTEESDNILKRAIQSVLSTELSREAESSEREKYIFTRMQNTLRKTVGILTSQVKKGGFVPSGFEVDFKELVSFGDLKYELSDGNYLNFSGKVDRIDSYEKDGRLYLKIIDYKSGSKSVDFTDLMEGLQLQLFTYLDAAVSGSQKRHPDKKVLPGAVLYYYINDPIVSADKKVGSLSLEEISDLNLEALKSEGLINRSIEVQDALDFDLEKSSASKVAKISKDKDGNYKDLVNLVSEEDFSIIMDYVHKKIEENGNKILEGEMTASPAVIDPKRRPCDYCSFHAICGFDSKVQGYKDRRMQKIAKADALMEMRRQLGRADTEDEKNGKEDGNE